MANSDEVEILACRKAIEFAMEVGFIRGEARNFGLGGPSCDANILVKTNFYTHIYKLIY